MTGSISRGCRVNAIQNHRHKFLLVAHLDWLHHAHPDANELQKYWGIRLQQRATAHNLHTLWAAASSGIRPINGMLACMLTICNAPLGTHRSMQLPYFHLWLLPMNCTYTRQVEPLSETTTSEVGSIHSSNQLVHLEWSLPRLSWNVPLKVKTQELPALVPHFWDIKHVWLCKSNNMWEEN